MHTTLQNGNGNSPPASLEASNIEFPIVAPDLDESPFEVAADAEEEEESLGGFGLSLPAEHASSGASGSAADAEGLDLAALTGYNPRQEISAGALVEGVSADEPASSDGSELDADAEFEAGVVDPRAVKTKHGIIGSPFTKLLVVGAGTLVVVLAIGAFLTSVTGDKKQAPIAVVPTPTPLESPLSGNSDEVAKFKTETALARQKELLNGATPPQPLPSPTPSVKPTTLATSAPVALPQALPMLPTAFATAPLAAPTALTAAPLDPLEKWRLAATMGSYGNIPSGFSGSSAATQVPVTLPPVAYTPPVVPFTSSSNGALALTQLRAQTATPGLRDQPLASVLVGSTVRAELVTAIIMAGDNSTPVAPESPSAIRYLIKLTGDLKDADGNVALPSGAQVVIVARTFSQQGGSAEFVATAVIVNNKEYSAPKDALVVRSTNGGLLAFNKEKTSGGLFQSILPAFFAGVSQAGQILNQPTSSSSVSGGNVSATTTSSNPSAAAGFVQGFGSNLAQSMQQKAQAANQAAAAKPASWSLQAGTAVSLFVNASFQL